MSTSDIANILAAGLSLLGIASALIYNHIQDKRLLQTWRKKP